MMPGPNHLSYAWLGRADPGLEWLRERIETFDFHSRSTRLVHYSASIDWETMAGIGSTGLDRLILVCADRISYPAKELVLWQRYFPDVPVVAAVGSWWDGARRTGIGEVEHLLLPWYRWWDGWTDWLSGVQPSLFGPCHVAAERMPGVQGSSKAERGTRRGIIVANCRSMAEAWLGLVNSTGAEATTVSSQAFADWTPRSDIDWVVWDDSCLDTFPGLCQAGTPQFEDRALLDFLALVSDRFPSALTIVASSMPRIDQWRAAAEGGAREFIAKPSCGRALANIFDRCL
jgi:hypothetical protein